MAANTSPVFTLTPIVASVTVTTATTDSPARVGTGNNFVTVRTGSTNGDRIDRITIQSTGTSVAGALLLFVNDTVNNFFIKEIAISAITASTTVAAFTAELVRTDGLPLIVLPATYILKAAVSVTQTNPLVISAYGGAY